MAEVNLRNMLQSDTLTEAAWATIMTILPQLQELQKQLKERKDDANAF